MKRDACLCLTCLSEMSQVKNRAIVTTTCQGCGKELIARAEPGYHYCAVCSTIEQRCMSCGEARSTASEQLAVSLIRKLTEWDATLTWSYEAAGSVLEFEISLEALLIFVKMCGHICFRFPTFIKEKNETAYQLCCNYFS